MENFRKRAEGDPLAHLGQLKGSEEDDEEEGRGTYSIMGWNWIRAPLWLAIPLRRRILSGFIWIAGH